MVMKKTILANPRENSAHLMSVHRSKAEVDFQKTLDAVHAIWPETEEAITRESFLSLS